MGPFQSTKWLHKHRQTKTCLVPDEIGNVSACNQLDQSGLDTNDANHHLSLPSIEPCVSPLRLKRKSCTSLVRIFWHLSKMSLSKLCCSWERDMKEYFEYGKWNKMFLCGFMIIYLQYLSASVLSVSVFLCLVPLLLHERVIVKWPPGLLCGD